MSGAGTAIVGHYSVPLVAASFFIAVLSAYSSLDLAGRAAALQGRPGRHLWVGGGAIAMGFGIWSMHYIGMQALRLPVVVEYDWRLVLLSLICAILGSGVALAVVSRKTMGRTSSILGSLSMAGAIAGMHYIGMESMCLPATRIYSPVLVTLSLVSALVTSYMAIALTFQSRNVTTTFGWRKALSALLMGIGIPVTHYVGMSAARFLPDPFTELDFEHAINISDLGVVSIALVTIVVLGIVFVTAIIDRRIWSVEQQLFDSNERYSLATQATTDGIWDWNCISGEFYYSARLRAIMGFPAQEHWGTIEDWLLRLNHRDAIACRANIWRIHTSAVMNFESEYRVLHADGTCRWVQNRGIAVRDHTGKLLRLAGAITDNTLRVVRDSLTGLHTRASMLDHLERRIDQPALHSRRFAILFIDLDGFKRINDTFGHSSGDLLLVELSRRLEQALVQDPDSIAARIGGDEFVVLLNEIDDEADALAYANRIQTLLQLPIQCASQHVRISASIGIAIENPAGGSAENLLDDSDMAMYQAKENGKAQSFIFTEGMREISKRRLELEFELRDAVAKGDLVLHYQPKVLLSTGKVIGFEALIRWQHTKRGLIGPEEFISVAEQSDLILEIGRWTLGEAIQQLASWRSSGITSPSTTMAVNLSPRQFADHGLVDDLIRKLELYQLPASCLEVEVTESILILDAETALDVLQRLKTVGVGLELDDFGIGYSSLSYLHRFPFSSLKVDRSFVQGLGIGSDSSTITRSIIALGQALNVEVIAEGVETADQVRRLQEMGCLYGQGYLFSKPIPADEMELFLRAQEASRTAASKARLQSPGEGRGQALLRN